MAEEHDDQQVPPPPPAGAGASGRATAGGWTPPGGQPAWGAPSAQQGWGAPAPPRWEQQGGWGPQPVQATNGLAIASLVAGITGFFCFVGWVLALIFGYQAKGQIRRTGQDGGGMATAGIVLGWVGLGLSALLIILALLFFLPVRMVLGPG